MLAYSYSMNKTFKLLVLFLVANILWNFFMSRSSLNINSQIEAKEMSLEEIKQFYIKEIEQLEILIKDKEEKLKDLSTMNKFLFSQEEKNNKIILNNDLYLKDLNEKNQSAIRKIDQLKHDISEKNTMLSEIYKLNRELFKQIEDKEKLLFHLKNKMDIFNDSKYSDIAFQDNITAINKGKILIRERTFESLKASFAVSEKQIAILRKVISDKV